MSLCFVSCELSRRVEAALHMLARFTRVGMPGWAINLEISKVIGVIIHNTKTGPKEGLGAL